MDDREDDKEICWSMDFWKCPVMLILDVFLNCLLSYMYLMKCALFTNSLVFKMATDSVFLRKCPVVSDTKC